MDIVLDNRPETPRKKIEIKHTDTCDVLLNNPSIALQDKATMTNLITEISGGIPTTWMRISPTENAKSTRAIHYGSTGLPDFLAKKREVISPETLATFTSVFRRAGNPFQSLMQELMLSDQIYGFLQNPPYKLGREVTRRGFRRITTIPAIIGLNDRAQKEKWMIYPYVDGADIETYYANALPNKSYGDDMEDIVYELKELLYRHNIIPQDIAERQFRVGKDLTLYLIDTEGYYKRNVWMA